MKKLIVLGLTLAFAGALSARHATINIEDADKVIVKTGLSAKMVHKHLMMKVKCLLNLKKHKTVDEAVDAAMDKVKAKCEKLSIADDKCKKMKMRVIKGIHSCYTGAEFIREFLKEDQGPVAEPEPAVVKGMGDTATKEPEASTAEK